MYISQFAAGVVATIVAEIAIVLLVALYQTFRGNGKDK